MDERDRPESNASDERRDRLTPLDVQQKEFRVSFRGYNEREVDEFLDKVTEELQRYEAELMRLRSERASFDPASFDLDAETQRVLRDARDRADAIVREAEARAAGIPTASGAETRAVVAPYLNREREFLQSLGTLVQDHAQTIKTMVEEARRRTEASAVAEPPVAEPIVAEPPPAAAAVPAIEPPSAVEVVPGPESEEAGDAAVAAADDTGTSNAGDQDVVVVGEDEPVRASAERAGRDRDPEATRSLRELFWGED